MSQSEIKKNGIDLKKIHLELKKLIKRKYKIKIK